MQRKAAMTTEGPLLLLAGAGSGKTTVLIQRVYTLLTYGRGSDSEEVPEWAEEEDIHFLEAFPDRPTDLEPVSYTHLASQPDRVQKGFQADLAGILHRMGDVFLIRENTGVILGCTIQGDPLIVRWSSLLNRCAVWCGNTFPSSLY